MKQPEQWLRGAVQREIVEVYFNGDLMRALSQKYDVCRTLIPIWIEKYERGEFDDAAVEEELLPEYETSDRGARTGLSDVKRLRSSF